MNTLTFLKKKLELIESKEILADLDVILNHLTLAEKHFNNGTNDQDLELFNDVIYRTNQAYEGILRLAYENILKKAEKNKSNIEIEEELLKENVINELTKKYIALYRGDIRNKSLHNYKIKFSESDAFLAINNVTSFLYTLINRLQINDAYMVMNKKEEKIKEIVKSLLSKNLSFDDLLEEALLKFPEIYFSNPKSSDLDNGFYVLGELEAYLEHINKNWKISVCPNPPEEYYDKMVDSISSLIPDLLIKTKEKTVIIEICMDKDFNFRNNFITSILEESEVFNADYGIILQMTDKTKYLISEEISKPIEIKRIYPSEKEENYNE